MDLIKVKSLDQATAYIKTFTLNHSDRWITSLEEGCSRVLEAIHASTTVEEVESAVNDLFQQQFTFIQKETTDTLDVKLWYTCVECYITAHLHDVVFGALCVHLERHDTKLLECCLNSSDVKCSDIAVPAVVPLTAAVVELSNLDAHTTALEKLTCLCTAHDMVYAELKAALIELQADGEIGAAENGGGIVVVERGEVVVLLAAVIARSKPQHMYTNLYYVQAFGAHLFDNSVSRQIYEDFSAAVERLATKTAPIVEATPIHQLNHLELSDIVELAATDNSPDSEPLSSSNTLLRNQRRRLLNLITTATTQYL